MQMWLCLPGMQEGVGWEQAEGGPTAVREVCGGGWQDASDLLMCLAMAVERLRAWESTPAHRRAVEAPGTQEPRVDAGGVKEGSMQPCGRSSSKSIATKHCRCMQRSGCCQGP